VGYTDFARVIQHYTHFIRSAKPRRKAAPAGGAERFVDHWPWLIYTYLEQASTERQRMEEAILAGDIAWHGPPFTATAR
jgi:hypothetical protein